MTQTQQEFVEEVRGDIRKDVQKANIQYLWEENMRLRALSAEMLELIYEQLCAAESMPLLHRAQMLGVEMPMSYLTWKEENDR